MTVLLVTLSESRLCGKCGQFINQGERAIKSLSRKSSCGGSYLTTAFYHEGCWKPGQRKVKV